MIIELLLISYKFMSTPVQNKHTQSLSIMFAGRIFSKTLKFSKLKMYCTFVVCRAAELEVSTNIGDFLHVTSPQNLL